MLDGLNNVYFIIDIVGILLDEMTEIPVCFDILTAKSHISLVGEG